MDNRISKEIGDLFNDYKTHRIGAHSDDWGGAGDKPCLCDLKPKLEQLLIKARLDELGRIYIVNGKAEQLFSLKQKGDPEDTPLSQPAKDRIKELTKQLGEE